MRKKIIFIFSFLLLGGINSGFSQQITSSKIKEVTLFTNQALIKRVTELKAKKGINEIFLEVGAFHIDKDSIQAKVFGKGSLWSVQYKEIYLKEAPQKNIKELEKKIESLKEERDFLYKQLDILNKKEEFLDSLIEFSQTQIPKEIKTQFPKIESLNKTLDFLEENLEKSARKKRDLNKKIKETDKEIKVLEKELNSIKIPHQKVKKVIEIIFDSKKDQTIKIEVSYLVYNCFWQPLYKINVPLNLEEINLIMFSKIKQKSGEDWRSIKLTISNVTPLKGIFLPSLDSWFLDIGRFSDKHSKGGRKAKIALFSLGEDKRVKRVMNQLLEAPEEAEFVYATKKKLPLSFEYQLPQIISIESKEKETILPLFQKKLKGEFFYYAVPKKTSLVFLVSNITSDRELLSGPLNVYFGGRFIGKTYLEEKKAGQKFLLNLGATKDIRIRREKIKDKIKETFFGKIERKTIIREIAFKINIENLKEEPIKIKVLDNMPVSKTDRIEVKGIKVSPSPKKVNYQGKEGIYLWELELNPKEEKEISVEFTITYPKGAFIVGLP